MILKFIQYHNQNYSNLSKKEYLVYTTKFETMNSIKVT